MRKFIILFFMSVLLLSCEKVERNYPKEGENLPEFSVTDNEGNTITNKLLSSGKSLIVFFHTQCKDCQEELPSVDSVFTNYKSKVNVVAISRAENEKSIKDFWNENHLSMPYSAQEDRTVYDQFTDCGVPHCVIVIEGKIKKIFNEYKDKIIPSFEMLKKEFEL